MYLRGEKMTEQLQATFAVNEYDEKIVESKYTYNLTFAEIMKDDTYDEIYGNPKGLCFRGTPRLKKGLNQVKFLYRRGYHSGVTKIFRYGFSIIQHDIHHQVRYIDQARFTAGPGQTPEQKEEQIAMWSNTIPLCPDLKRTVSINVSVRDNLAQAITDSAEIIGICAGDLEIAQLYAALSRCEGLDEDVYQEGSRFAASLRSVIGKKSKDLEILTALTESV